MAEALSGDHVDAFCRWNSLAGYYLFGETPTVVDPRQSGMPDTSLANVHEQSHRDLVNNTLYGYALPTLREIRAAGHKGPADIGGLLVTLSGRIWYCAEGSATAMELIALRNRETESDIPAFLAALPADYREALSLFRPFTRSTGSSPEVAKLMLQSCLIHAVAEAAADWALFTSRDFQESFWKLAHQLQSAAAPDEVLPKLVRTASRFPLAPPALLLDGSQNLLESNDVARFTRLVIHHQKFSLLAAHGIKPAPKWLNDDDRIELFRALDAQLNEEFSGLLTRQWRTGPPLGGEVTLETKEPPFLLAEEEVEPARLLDRMRELAAAPDFETFVVQFFLDGGKPKTYTVLAAPIKVTETAVDQAEPYLVCRKTAPDILHAVDESDLALCWSTEAIVLLSGGFFDAEFVASLRNAVFLQLTSFSWEKALAAANAIPGERVWRSYDMPWNPGVSIAAIEVGERTIFGMTPGRFAPDPGLGQDVTDGDLHDNFDLAVVTMVLLRQSREHTV